TSKCVATFTTSQTLARVKDGKAAPAAAASQLKPITKPADVQTVAAPPEVVKKAEPGARACVPGAPAHLTLRPKRADIEVGQRVCFRARVTDAKDCAIENANVEWSLSHSHALRGEIEGGCFSAARTTAEAEGEFKILASALGLKADASVGVHSVDLSALIAKRMEGDAVQGFEEQAAPVVAPPPKATAKIATRTVSARQKPNQKPIWLAATGLLVLLGLGGLALAAKRKPAVGGPAISGGSDDDEPTDGDERSHTHDHGPSHPTVGSSGGSQHRPSAASAPQQRVSGGGAAPTLMAVPQMNPQPAPQPVSTRPPVQAGEPWICPLCRVGYPAEQKTCPRDGSALMPYSDFNRRIREGEQAKQKRCPKCGDMFPATSAFCGKDGASLVDV
ncbi:MAG TPA: hypothetical protein VHM19_13135, partial [Polyangiales bacterium]|nr:hypothetical protein [Polyangiales bacterium]